MASPGFQPGAGRKEPHILAKIFVMKQTTKQAGNICDEAVALKKSRTPMGSPMASPGFQPGGWT